VTLLSAFLAALFAALAMIAGHYLVPVILGRELRPPWTYAWGVAVGIYAPFGAWLCFTPGHPGRCLILASLAIVIAGAGAGTIVCYLADWWMGYRAERRINGKQRSPNAGDH
jgi:hypothetical protein